MYFNINIEHTNIKKYIVKYKKVYEYYKVKKLKITESRRVAMHKR